MTGFLVLPDTRIELFAASEDIRYYLQWPYLDLSEPDKPMLVATNGHYLGAAPVVVEGDVPQGPITKRAIRCVRKAKKNRLYFEGDMHGLQGEAMFKRPDLTIKYPEWRRVMSADRAADEGAPDISFAGNYLDRMQRALTDTQFPGLQIRCARKDDGSLDPTKAVRITPLGTPRSKGVIALLMPQKMD